MLTPNTAVYDSSSLRSGPRSERCSRRRLGSGGNLVRPPLHGSQEEHGVTHRGTPPFGSSGSWKPLPLAPGTMRSDPGHRTARIPGAATTHAAGPDKWMSRLLHDSESGADPLRIPAPERRPLRQITIDHINLGRGARLDAMLTGTIGFFSVAPSLLNPSHTSLRVSYEDKHQVEQFPCLFTPQARAK